MRLPVLRRRFLPKRIPTRLVAAFSLIEVLLAIGIIAFAFMALVGLIPVGLNIFRESINTSVGSRILQQVVNEAQQTDFRTLIATSTHERYFDEEGTEVPQGDSIYTAQISVTPGTTLPGGAPAESLATLVVKVAHNPAHQSLSDSRRYPTYSALVARTSSLE